MTGWREARNILAVHLDNLGDVVMLGPALRAVKHTSPGARITLLASPGGSPAATLLPWIDDVIQYRPLWQDIGSQFAFHPDQDRDLIVTLTDRHFDAALIFTSFSQTPHVAGYVCYLAGIPLRVGESKEFGGGVLTGELKGAPDEMHQAERNLRLVERAGFTAIDRNLSIHISADARLSARNLLHLIDVNPDEPYVVVHPGASTSARRYDADRYGASAAMLVDRGWPVIVTGVERERHIVETIARMSPRSKVLMGKTSLSEYAAILEGATLAICNNTLTVHLADAVRTSAVVLYSGTDYIEQWRPHTISHVLLRKQTPCHPCYLFECPIGKPCLDIAPSRVVEAAEDLLRITPNRDIRGTEARARDGRIATAEANRC